MEKLVYEEIINIKDNGNIYNYLFDRTYELIVAINKHKHIPFKEKNKNIYSLKSFLYYLENNTIMFDEINNVIYNLEFFLDNDTENQTKLIIHSFNKMVDAYNNYIDIYNEIEKRSFDKLNEELIRNITNLFKDMLKYKNRYYGDKDNFDKLLSRVRLCYYDFSYLLDDIRTAVKSGTVYILEKKSILRLDTIEYIYLLRNNYYIISSQYKDYEAINYDIYLKEGQTVQDLINIIDNELNELYVSILGNNKNINIDNLEDEFIAIYPEYYEDIYKIRSIEDDDQLVYYYKKDLYDKIKNKFK